jgi:hypothetical protein
MFHLEIAAQHSVGTQHLTGLALHKWLSMRYNVLMIIRQRPELGLRSGSSYPPQSTISGNPFASHTYAKLIFKLSELAANPFTIRTYKAVHSKSFEVTQNHSHSQKLEEGPDRVISPTPNQARLVPSTLTPNPVNGGAPPSGVGGWVLGSSRSASGVRGCVLGSSPSASGFSRSSYVRS